VRALPHKVGEMHLTSVSTQFTRSFQELRHCSSTQHQLDGHRHRRKPLLANVPQEPSAAASCEEYPFGIESFFVVPYVHVYPFRRMISLTALHQPTLTSAMKSVWSINVTASDRHASTTTNTYGVPSSLIRLCLLHVLQEDSSLCGACGLLLPSPLVLLLALWFLQL
jgi:hypothetical protein